MRELIERAAREGYAVPAFCVWNVEGIRIILETATRLRAPVILMHDPAALGMVPPKIMGAVACAVAESYSVQAVLHLDHGDSLELVRECLEAGYTSVMLDFSSRSFDENTCALWKVGQWAHERGVTVEGELGAVGRADSIKHESSGFSTLTDPDEAKTYVAATAVDALAVSIGNAHGNYAVLPQFDFDRLSAIRRQVSVPLVLHGGSGTPETDLKKAIALGIAKVNVGTELVNAMRHSIQQAEQEKQKKWFPHVLANAMLAIMPVVEKWIYLTGAAGKG